jgi:hypothetical protein
VRYPATLVLMGVLTFLPEALYLVFGNENNPVSPTSSNCSLNGTSPCNYHFQVLLTESTEELGPVFRGTPSAGP